MLVHIAYQQLGISKNGCTRKRSLLFADSVVGKVKASSLDGKRWICVFVGHGLAHAECISGFYFDSVSLVAEMGLQKLLLRLNRAQK